MTGATYRAAPAISAGLMQIFGYINTIVSDLINLNFRLVDMFPWMAMMFCLLMTAVEALIGEPITLHSVSSKHTLFLIFDKTRY